MFDEILKTRDCEQSAQKALTSRHSHSGKDAALKQSLPANTRRRQPETSLTLGEVNCDSLARKQVLLQPQTLETTERSYQRVTSYTHFSDFLWTGDASLY